jgi:hypothetical protein
MAATGSNKKKKFVVTFENGSTRVCNAQTIADMVEGCVRCKEHGDLMMPDKIDNMQRIIDIQPIPSRYIKEYSSRE